MNLLEILPDHDAEIIDGTWDCAVVVDRQKGTLQIDTPAKTHGEGSSYEELDVGPVECTSVGEVCAVLKERDIPLEGWTLWHNIENPEEWTCECERPTEEETDWLVRQVFAYSDEPPPGERVEIGPRAQDRLDAIYKRRQ